MKKELLNRSETISHMDRMMADHDGLIKTDLEAGRFIKDSARSEELWVLYKSTSKTSGDWYVWNGVVHEDSGMELDDLLVTCFLDAATEKRKRANQATAAAIGIYKASALYSQLEIDAKAKDETPPHLTELNAGQIALVPGLDLAVRAMEAAWKNVKVEEKELTFWKSSPGINRLKERVRHELKVYPEYFADNRNYVVMNTGWCYDVNDLTKALPPSHERAVIRHLNVGLEIGNDDYSWDDLMRMADTTNGPRWQAWLDEFVPDKEDQSYLQEACGAALLGKGKARNIVHLVGPPATGKSTFLNIMEMVFGRKDQSGYAGTLSKEAIVKKNGSNFMQAEAKDVRFLKLSEPSTDRTDDSFLKNLSGGGEAIVTEKKNQNPEEWFAECVLFVAANSVLRFATWDTALVDRLNIVHFNTRVKTIDPDFDEELVRAEGPAILAWVLDGAERYAKRGSIYVPEVIKQRAEDNVVDSSNALRWLRESDRYTYDQSGDAVVSKCVLQAEAFKDYQDWCFENGEKARTKRLFVEDIHRHNNMPEGKSVRSDGTRLFGVMQRSVTRDAQADYETFKGIVNTGF